MDEDDYKPKETPYERFYEQLRPELQKSDASEFLKLLDRIASLGQELYLDFDALFHRVRPHCAEYHPRVLIDLYDECADVFDTVFDTVLAASRACNRHMACCCRFFDPTMEIENLPVDAEPITTFDAFIKQYARLRYNIRVGGLVLGRNWAFDRRRTANATLCQFRRDPVAG
ncbi:hypothetical protein C8R47DRAFT_1212342 [Mycena vitilis]|nr:hypothetical protein C8R47DRAFT_1212342 [Mycena vitilis]